MAAMYLGIIIFFIGATMTLGINRNVNVPMSGDFGDMPVRIKTGILFVILGILLLAAGVIVMLITNPVELLSTR